jgi:hypothetical protein
MFLFEKQVVVEMVNRLTAFYVTRKFFNLSTKGVNWTLFFVQLSPVHTMPLRYILILL